MQLELWKLCLHFFKIIRKKPFQYHFLYWLILCVVLFGFIKSLPCVQIDTPCNSCVLCYSEFSEPASFYTSGSVPSQPDPPMLSEPFTTALVISWIKHPNEDTFQLQMDDESTVSQPHIQNHAAYCISDYTYTSTLCMHINLDLAKCRYKLNYFCFDRGMVLSQCTMDQTYHIKWRTCWGTLNINSE